MGMLHCISLRGDASLLYKLGDVLKQPSRLRNGDITRLLQGVSLMSLQHWKHKLHKQSFLLLAFPVAKGHFMALRSAHILGPASDFRRRASQDALGA